MMRHLLAVLALTSVAVPASAQYYSAPPPPPPPGYYPRGEYYAPPRVRFGRRCDAVIRTPYGRRHVVCPIIEAKPLGMECACPPPPEFPGGPYVGGVTIR